MKRTLNIDYKVYRIAFNCREMMRIIHLEQDTLNALFLSLFSSYVNVTITQINGIDMLWCIFFMKINGLHPVSATNFQHFFTANRWQ